MDTLYAVATFVSLATDPVPDKQDIKAGWGALSIFLAMAVAVALLGWSLTRHLKKTKQNADAGAFGDVAATPPDSSSDL